jgi:hypothetical protein
MATHGSSSEDDGDDGDDKDSSSDEEVESMVAEYVKKIFKYVKKVNMYGYNTLQGFPPIATISLGNTTNSVAIEGYYCIETVIRLQFVCLLQHKICVAIFIFCVATS